MSKCQKEKKLQRPWLRNSSVRVSIDLEQFRFDLRAEIREPISFLKNAELRLGIVDYMHTELEGEAVGTKFNRDGVEARILTVHRPMGIFNGVLGFNYKHNDFAAAGEEAFIPSNKTSNWALFIVERTEFNWGSWEYGFRYINHKKSTSSTHSERWYRKFDIQRSKNV